MQLQNLQRIELYCSGSSFKNHSKGRSNSCVPKRKTIGKRKAQGTFRERWVLQKIMESSVWGVVMIILKNILYTTNSNEKILDDINLNIKKNEFVVITRKSGSGKTTLA